MQLIVMIRAWGKSKKVMSSVDVLWGKSGCFSEIYVKCIINTLCKQSVQLMVHKVTTKLQKVTNE
jgi:hypothetical protein